MARRGGALNAEKQLGEAFAAARQFHVTTPSASISPINLQRAWSAFQRSAPPYVRASHSHGIVIIGGGPRYLTPTLTRCALFSLLQLGSMDHPLLDACKATLYRSRGQNTVWKDDNLFQVFIDGLYACAWYALLACTVCACCGRS